MRHTNIALLSAVSLCLGHLASPSAALAQAAFPFQLVVQEGSVTQVVASGTTINVGADSINKPVSLTLTVTFTGTTSATLSTPQLVGAADFQVTPAAPSPAVLLPGHAAVYSITFTASTKDQVSALLTIPFSEPVLAPAGLTTGFISLGLAGTAPNFLFSYAFPPLSNAVPVSDGGTIQFPATQVGNTGTVVLAITNNGSTAGVLSAVTLSGPPFQTQSLPLLPGGIGAGQSLQLTLLYKPLAVQTDKGTLQITLGSQTITLNLLGTGTALQYQVTEAGQTSTVSPNQTISAPDTNVGSSSTVSVTVMNNGTADAIVNFIAVTGVGFALTTAPGVPVDIAPNATATLTFAFTPQQAGTFSGRLQIGTDSFPLAGKGLGVAFQYSYGAGSGTTTVVPGGSIFFPSVPLGQSSSTTFTVTNAGTISGTISSIFIGEANSPFSVSNPPPLPVTLAPSQSASFQVNFTPAVTTPVAGTLHLDANQFGLSGTGGAPPQLSAYTFNGASGTESPLQQPTVGLSLANPYSLPVSGTLTMNVVPDGFTSDPAIQFSTGGRTVAFTIPANTTNAVFANGATSIKLQTGSTSGTITLVPSFQTATGVPLIPPNSQQSVQFTVPRLPPQLFEAELSVETANGFTLLIGGVSDSQVLSRVDLTFTPLPNYNLTNPTVTVPLSGVASAWFQSAAATPFGGQFVLTLPFNFTSNSSTLTTPAATIKSVSLTVTNDQGTSSPVVVTLQ